ncbi:MAG: hypothetical protein WA775_03740 [Psychroserpens sp.]|uniref:hypothetical protein n=1 Tax=Psychroserpens sp. TaxID=2020870 RepID=UPI003C71DCF7
MRTSLKVIKDVNIIALCFIIFGPYGFAIIGFLQTIVALMFLIMFPKQKSIYLYFAISILFFLIWPITETYIIFALPLFLTGYLTYIIQTKKI